MSDLIRREDAIKAVREYAEKHTFNSYHKGMLKAVSIIANLPTADRPKGEWKVINKTINTTLVSCSECGKRFHIPNYCFKSERDRWKCCPICCADMRGEDNGQTNG